MTYRNLPTIALSGPAIEAVFIVVAREMHIFAVAAIDLRALTGDEIKARTTVLNLRFALAHDDIHFVVIESQCEICRCH